MIKRARPGTLWPAIRRRKLTWAVVALALTLCLIGAVVREQGPRLQTPGTGDPALVSTLTNLLAGPVRHRVAAVVVTRTQARYALFGADRNSPFAIGSITKSFTGQLLAEAIARREVSTETRLNQFVQVGAAPIGQARLVELATYRAGLGLWGDDARDGGVERWWTEQVRGGTIHHADFAEILDRARHDPLSTKGGFNYSNIAIALLGEALARAASTDYAALAQTRLFSPLGMTSTGLPTNLRNSEPGYRADGRSARPWQLGAYASSGGAWSTISDMARFVRAGLVEPRMAMALDPQIIEGSPTGTGYGWIISDRDGAAVDSKEGLIGGYASAVVLDRRSGVAVVILSDTANPVIDTAWRLWEQYR